MAGQSNAIKLNGGAHGQALQDHLDIAFGAGAAVGLTYAVGGSALTVAMDQADWFNPGELQAGLAAAIKAALDATPDSYLAGVLWVQGEADTRDIPQSVTYAAQLADLVQRLDGALISYGNRVSDYAFVVMALSAATPFGASRAHWDMIRDAQLGLTGGQIVVVDPDQIAAAHGLAPAEMFGADGLHYNANAMPMLLDALISPAPQYRTGTSAADRLTGMAGADRLLGLGGADVIIGGAGRDYVDGGAGNDLILTLGDGDRLFGGAGLDTLIFAGNAGVTVNLYQGTTTLDLRFWQFENVKGTGGADNIAGDAATNQLDGAAGDDVLSGFGGNDRLFGADGADILYGNDGADRLFGGAGNDALRGAAQNDVLFGDAGRDLLRGGDGIDQLTGGLGDDFFDFMSLAEAQTGTDLIRDFSTISGNNDTVRISTAFAAGLVAGVLPQGRFVAQASNLAPDADDRFIFRTTDGTLWFDSNGSAAGGLTLLADLQAGAILTAADILIF